MNDFSALLDSVGTVGVVALGGLILVQLTLMIAALVSLIRTAAERLRAPKWVWALVILFVNTIGPIVYFAVARKPQAVDVTHSDSPAQAERAAGVADLLYGEEPKDVSDTAQE
jgi:hypothetical protein